MTLFNGVHWRVAPVVLIASMATASEIDQIQLLFGCTVTSSFSREKMTNGKSDVIVDGRAFAPFGLRLHVINLRQIAYFNQPTTAQELISDK